jgi:hypothetical protein
MPKLSCPTRSPPRTRTVHRLHRHSAGSAFRPSPPCCPTTTPSAAPVRRRQAASGVRPSRAERPQRESDRPPPPHRHCASAPCSRAGHSLFYSCIHDPTRHCPRRRCCDGRSQNAFHILQCVVKMINFDRFMPQMYAFDAVIPIGCEAPFCGRSSCCIARTVGKAKSRGGAFGWGCRHIRSTRLAATGHLCRADIRFPILYKRDPWY